MRRAISPRKFANAAKEANVTFTELLRLISRMYLGGQNQSFQIAERLEQVVQQG